MVYLVFNEGYAATRDEQLVRAELCEEAIWLGRLLHRLLHQDAESAELRRPRTPGAPAADAPPQTSTVPQAPVSVPAPRVG